MFVVIVRLEIVLRHHISMIITKSSKVTKLCVSGSLVVQEARVVFGTHHYQSCGQSTPALRVGGSRPGKEVRRIANPRGLPLPQAHHFSKKA